MKAAFSVLLDIGTDTNLLGVAQDVQDMFDAHSEFQCEKVTPFPHPSLGVTNPVTIIPPGLPPQ